MPLWCPSYPLSVTFMAVSLCVPHSHCIAKRDRKRPFILLCSPLTSEYPPASHCMPDWRFSYITLYLLLLLLLPSYSPTHIAHLYKTGTQSSQLSTYTWGRLGRSLRSYYTCSLTHSVVVVCSAQAASFGPMFRAVAVCTSFVFLCIPSHFSLQAGLVLLLVHSILYLVATHFSSTILNLDPHP